jgi:hypothetical protein
VCCHDKAIAFVEILGLATLANVAASLILLKIAELRLQNFVKTTKNCQEILANSAVAILRKMNYTYNCTKLHNRK